MKTLLRTTALALVLGLPSLTLAQATPPATDPTLQTQTPDTTGFLSGRGQTDIFASELIGLEVYARRTPADLAATDGQVGVATDGTGEMAAITRADLDTMDNIGEINEIVLSHDGQVRAIVIGVGGFLGVGEQDVAVTMDQVMFAADREDPSEMYVVVNTGEELLRASPRYERTVMTDGVATGLPDGAATETTAAPTEDRTAFNAPEMTREGYNRVEVAGVSAELLTGKSVYDVNDNSVGKIDDLLLDDAGAVSHVIIDFGGFLGIGSSQASLAFEELTILSNDGDADVRVYVDATKEQIQALPQYEGVN